MLLLRSNARRPPVNAAALLRQMLAISGPDFYGWGFTPNQSGDGFVKDVV